MRVVFSGLVFLAALLLFAVEPMSAKHLLPVLGGASAVWVTALVFFQAALLVGYLYAHWIVRSGWIRVHLIVLGAATLAAGIVSVAGALQWNYSRADVRNAPWAALHPVSTVFLYLSGTIGLPFVALAATSPLLQVWWVRICGGRVPYGLFALSNAGSLLGLFLYPSLIEPHMTLRAQQIAWAFGFGLFAALCAWVTLQVSRHTRPAEAQGFAEVPPLGSCAANGARLSPLAPAPDTLNTLSARRKWMWFLLPMGAAMQLSAITSHLSQDVAAIPMLWVLPLGVYLLTFIVAFEAPGLYRRWVIARLLAVALASLGYALSRVDTTLPIGMAIVFYMLELFVACWFCHAEAYRSKPDLAEAATLFYLLVAAGGVAGTFFIAVLSPLVFRANYDLAISFFVTAVLAATVTWRQGWPQRMLWVTGSGLLLGLLVALHIGFGRNALMRARNFYGALRVTQAQTDTSAFEENGLRDAAASGDVGTGPVRTLMNGRIRHGTQMQLADRRHVPTTYYAQDSGIGLAMSNCCVAAPRRVGVVGLGVGTLAAYGGPGDTFQFYEINPLVEPVARNLFTFLNDSAAQIRVIAGDGRSSLEREAPQAFNILVVDAFSGDAIPLHLLTKEAMEVYRRHLAPGGILAFHVSNSYLDLAPEIARLAGSIGMKARKVENFAAPARDQYRSTWVLVTADSGFFAIPAIHSASRSISVPAGLRLWTDDYSSLLPVMRWGR